MKKAGCFLLLLLILIAHTIVNYQVSKHSRILRAYDEPFYINSGFNYYETIFLANGKNMPQRLDCLFMKVPQQRFFLYFVEAMSWKLSNLIRARDEEMPILITNSVFMLILLLSVFGIGAILYNMTAGLLAAFLTSLFPLVVGHSRAAMTDFPLTCMLALSIFLLLKTNGFRSLIYSVFAGVAFALSQLTRENFIILIFCPFIYYIFKTYVVEDRKKVLSNLLITVTTFFLMTGFVFLKTSNANAHTLKTYWTVFWLPLKTDHLYYVKTFFVNAPGLLIFYLAIPLLISYAIHFRKRNKLVFLWFIVPLFFYSVSLNQPHRYLLPILPAFSLLLSEEMFSAGSFGLIKRIMQIALLPCALLQYALINMGFLGNTIYADQHEYGYLTAREDEFFPASQALMGVFRNESIACARQKTVLFLFLNVKLVCPFYYKFGLEGLPLILDCPMNADIVTAPVPGTVNWEERVVTADYIIDKTGFIPEQKGTRENIADQLKKGFNKHKKLFKLVDEIKTNKDFSILVYKRSGV